MALTDSLISFFELGESSGTRSDSHGTNHLADNNTVGVNTGRVGSAAEFTAVNEEWLSVANNASLQTGDVDFTYAAWVYLATVLTDGESQIFLAMDDGTNRQFYIEQGGGGVGDPWANFGFRQWGESSNLELQASTFGTPSAETWYFVLAEYVSATQTIGIQINNGTLDTGSLGSAARTASTVDFTVGRRAHATIPCYYDGRVDQVGFWKRILTTEEKDFLYNGGAGRTYADIAGGPTPIPVGPGSDNLNNWADSRTVSILPFTKSYALSADNLANYVDTPTVYRSTLGTGDITKNISADAMPAYGERLGIGRGFIDPRPSFTDSFSGFFTYRASLTDPKPAFVDTVTREQPIPSTGYVNWITEELLGQKSGTNQNFTVSRTPVVETMSVYISGIRQVRVAGTPTQGEAQYGVSGTNVVLGTAPNAAIGQWAVAKYFSED